MFEVEKVWVAVRREGHNCGIVTTFVRMGPGNVFVSVNELMGWLYPLVQTKWVCFTGEDTTRVGMGVIIRGLKELKIDSEIVTNGYTKEPGWFNSAALWCVDYHPEGSFNYDIMRPRDSLRLKIPERVAPEVIPQIISTLGLCTALRVVSLSTRRENKLEATDLSVLDDPRLMVVLRQLDRVRVGLRQD